VIQSAKGGDVPVRRLEPARWSLVPSWSKEFKLKYPTFNARSESIANKASWEGPLKALRALVPATVYFESQAFADGRKVPHFIHDPAGEQWSQASTPGGRTTLCRKTTAIGPRCR
jgi:putative SOS response-associated peptidase YedK